MYEEIYRMTVAQEDLLHYALMDVWGPEGFWPEPGHVTTGGE